MCVRLQLEDCGYKMIPMYKSKDKFISVWHKIEDGHLLKNIIILFVSDGARPSPL